MVLHPDGPRGGDEAARGPAAAGSSAEMAEEQVWVVPSIVLALVVLSGSVLLYVVVLVLGVALWILSTPPHGRSDGRSDRPGFPPGRPFGGPGLLP